MSSSLDGVLTTDGVPLKVSLRRVVSRQRWRAFLLVLPLLLFIGVGFCFPIFDMLRRSVDNEIVPRNLPRTVVALSDWDISSSALPPESVFSAMVMDLRVAQKGRKTSRLGQRLNYELSGMASLFRQSGREVSSLVGPPYRSSLVSLDSRWGESEVWILIKRLSSRFVSNYYLSSLDMSRDLRSGEISLVPEDERIYLRLFLRTLFLSLCIALMTLVLGFPIALLLARLPARTSNLLLILVFLPFWTSLLVRTTAWIVLLQKQGVLNDILVALSIVSEEGRLRMIYNTTGTIIAMTHILLPFMVLPLYSVMKTIPPSYVRAGISLGAHPWLAFWKIYFPNTLPGIGAGGIMVFILSIGYYITPELVGGRTGIFISNRIAYHVSSSLNWGLAAALGTILLGLIVAFYLLYNRLVGLDSIKMG